MEKTKLQTGTIERGSADAKDRFITGVAGGKTGGVDLANRTITGIASTIQVDRDGEIILPGAFKARLGKFTGGSSPFLTAHTHRTSTGDPGQIGWVVEIKVEKTQVPCKFRFVDDTDSAAERWWKLASDPNGKGIMFSIGFIPVRWVYGSALDLGREFPEIRQPLKDAGVSDEDRLRVYTEIELLEISAVPVPSNREAVQMLAAQMAGKDGEGALDEFEKQIAKSVVEQLDIGNWKSEIMDAIAVVRELITLSSDPLGMSAPPQKDAPAADEKIPDADESAGAIETGQQVKDAASSLLKACVP